MNKDEFIENVRQQFVDAEELTLTMDSQFRNFETYDSLTGMTIMVMLEDEYSVNISDSDFSSKKTVNDLYEYVLLNK